MTDRAKRQLGTSRGWARARYLTKLVNDAVGHDGFVGVQSEDTERGTLPQQAERRGIPGIEPQLEGAQECPTIRPDAGGP
jgi:hypothetical protein